MLTPFIYRFTETCQREKRAIENSHAFTNAVIEERRSNIQNNNFIDDIENYTDEFGAKRKLAFLDLLLQSKVDGKPLDDESIREEVDTFMFEGHDTTTSGITFCLLNIAKYPEVQQQIYEECCEVLGDKKPITMKDLNEMHYLENVIKETLRLYPSVPFFGRITSSEVDIGDYVVPAGISLIIAPIFIGRDPKYFSNPDQFNPNRFDEKQNSHFSYVPFSAGLISLNLFYFIT